MSEASEAALAGAGEAGYRAAAYEGEPPGTWDAPAATPGQSAGELAAQRLDWEAHLREAILIDPARLQEEFYNCSPTIASAAAVHGRAVSDLLRAKSRTKRLEGLLYLRAKDRLEAEQTALQMAENRKAKAEARKPEKVWKHVPEGVIESEMRQDPQWLAAQDAEAEAALNEAQARGYREAAMAKKDMLVQIGATLRAEMARDPIVRERLALHGEGR